MKRRAPRRLAIGLLALSWLAGAHIASRTLWGEQGVPKRQALEADLLRLGRDNAELEAQLERLRREIVAQKERPEVQEALVRDVLGYVRPGEIVLQPRR